MAGIKAPRRAIHQETISSPSFYAEMQFAAFCRHLHANFHGFNDKPHNSR